MSERIPPHVRAAAASILAYFGIDAGHAGLSIAAWVVGLVVECVLWTRAARAVQPRPPQPIGRIEDTDDDEIDPCEPFGCCCDDEPEN